MIRQIIKEKVRQFPPEIRATTPNRQVPLLIRGMKQNGPVPQVLKAPKRNLKVPLSFNSVTLLKRTLPQNDP